MHHDHGAAERLVDRFTVRHKQAPRSGKGDQTELELHSDKQRPLRTGEQPADIEGALARGVEAVGIHQGIQRVAGVAAGDGCLGEAALDLGTHLWIGTEGPQALVDAGLERVGAGALRLELRRRQRGEGRRGAVGKEAAHGMEMVARRSPGDGVGAAGVVPHHPADHRPGGGRCLRTEIEAVRREILVQGIADDARLDANRAPFDVERHDPVHVPTGVDDDPSAHHLPGQ